MAAASLTLGIVIGAPAPARGTANGWVTCQTNAFIRLFTDITMTDLVDAFGVTDAPTMHRIGSNDFVIQAEGGAPGVDVVGLLTGTPYTFMFRDIAKGFAPNPGGVSSGTGISDWRVTAQSGGVISDAHNQMVSIAHDGEAVVVLFWDAIAVSCCRGI